MTFYNQPNNPPQQTVVIGTGYTQVGAGIINCDGSIMSIEVVCAGPGNVNGFKIQAQFFPGGAYYDYLGNTDFQSSSDYSMIKASTVGPNQVTNGNGAWAVVRMDGVYAFLLQAKADTLNTTVTVNWIARKSRPVFGRGSPSA